jgi:hypothetical protein
MIKELLLWIGLPIIKRIMVGLGIGVITYTGSSLLIQQFINTITSSMTGVPAIMLQMASLFGVPDSIGILLGALSFQASLSAIKRFGFL